MSNSREWLNDGRVSVHYRVSIQRFYDIRNAYYLILVEHEYEEL